MKKDIFKVANKIIKSRLIVGTGKYKNFLETAKAIKASKADIVTVAVRRVNITDKKVYVRNGNQVVKVAEVGGATGGGFIDEGTAIAFAIALGG